MGFSGASGDVCGANRGRSIMILRLLGRSVAVCLVGLGGNQRRSVGAVQRRSAEVIFSEIPEISLLFQNGPKKSCKFVFSLFVAPTQARSQKNRTSACFQRFQTLSTKNMKNRKKTKKNVQKTNKIPKNNKFSETGKKSGGQRRSAEVSGGSAEVQRRSAEVSGGSAEVRRLQITPNYKKYENYRFMCFFAKFLIFL